MYTSKRLTDEFPEKGWTKPGVNKLLQGSSADEIPERDVTYRLIWLLIYHRTTTHLYSEIFLK